MQAIQPRSQAPPVLFILLQETRKRGRWERGCIKILLKKVYGLKAGGVRQEIRPIRMRHLWSDFRAREQLFSEVYVVKFSLYSKLVLVISTLYRRGKLLEHFILIAVALLLNILLS